MTVVLIAATGVKMYVAKQKKAMTIAELINSGNQFSTEATLVARVPEIGNYQVMQGGCVTEKYAWFVMLNSTDFPAYFTECYIFKYDTQTWEEISRSESLSLEHSNDIAYVPDTNELYVIHSSSIDNKRVSILDADTMEVKETVSLDTLGGYSIDYNAEKQNFVVGSSGESMIFFDQELNLLYVKMGKDVKLTPQGICVDNQYVYHVMYSHSSEPAECSNLIRVYDWDGNFVTQIPLNVPNSEAENVSLIGDTFYIGFNHYGMDGAEVYAVKLVKEPESEYDLGMEQR